MKTTNKRIACFLVLLIGLLSGVAKGQVSEFTGTVIDPETNKPLPFATIGFRSYRVGTVSDTEGNFTIRFNKKISTDTVTVSFIGYEDYSFLIANRSNVKIYLKPAVYQYEEVVIRSISSKEFMRKVIRKIPENFLDRPFETLSYYRGQMDENEIPIKYTEAAFVSYQQPFQIDSSSQHKLVLHRELADAEMQFMRERILKRKNKARKKAIKKGEEFDEESEFSAVSISFGGPEEILRDDPVRSLDQFMDTSMFKKFQYEFHESTIYNERPVEVISFSTKGKVDNEKSSRLIYVDKASLAIIKIDKKGKFIIPLVLKPLLYAAGFSINGGNFTSSFKYKSFDGKWYPENLHHTFHVKITKHNLFSKNQHAALAIEHIFSTKDIEIEAIRIIETSKRFDTSKSMEEQIFTVAGIEWNSVK